jgi:hypothetical protein
MFGRVSRCAQGITLHMVTLHGTRIMKYPLHPTRYLVCVYGNQFRHQVAICSQTRITYLNMIENI